jgi:putative ABC transport system permease protein
VRLEAPAKADGCISCNLSARAVVNTGENVFKNSLKIALRNFRRHPGFAAIDLGGLAVALAACLLIGLYVQDELGFDRFHTKIDRIYRLGGSSVGWPYGRIIASDYPEVEKVVYMRSWPAYSIEREGRHFFDRILYADGGFFDVFDFPVLAGETRAALADPYSIVLSEKEAEKLFGAAAGRAVGQTLSLGDDRMPCRVTAVVRVPNRSHIQFDALLSFATLRSTNPAWFDREMTSGWLDLNVANYVLLRPGTDPAAFAAKIRDLPQERAADVLKQLGSPYRLGLEPAGRVYLHSRSGNWLGPKSDIAYVILLGFVGAFLLLIACVNFVNLATARSVERAREVGIRKVSGSTRGALIRQFLVESFSTGLAAVCLSIGLVLLLLPFFNTLAAKTYSLSAVFQPFVAALLAGLALVVGILGGIYPAVVLSSFHPIEVLKGRFATGRRGVRLLQALVVLQFVISSVLIVATLVVVSQLRFMQRQKLGFDSEQVFVLDGRHAPAKEFLRREAAFKNALETLPGVEAVSASEAVPGRTGWRGQISFPEGWPEGASMDLEYVPVDPGYVRTFGLKIIAGRDFEKTSQVDAARAVLINRAAAEKAGWAKPEAAIGKGFTSPGSGKPDSFVIGVIEDYHHHGLRERVGPMMFGIQSGNTYFALRFKASEASSVVARATRTWTEFFEGYPATSFFVNEDFARQYEADRRLGRIFGAFATLAVLIAGLGLFGLATSGAAQRIKEIGVRKVMGASMADIILLLAKEFLRPVLVAFVVAAPVGYYVMRRWLESFAYQTAITVGVFAAGAALLLLASAAAVGYQAVAAARAVPARSLRYE